MQILTLPFNLIKPAAVSFTLPDARKNAQLRNTVSKHGQVYLIPIYIDADNIYRALSHHCLLEILSELGYTEVVCRSYGELTDAEAALLSLELNLHQPEIDKVAVAVALKELNTHITTDKLSESIPLTQQQIEAYVRWLDFDFNALLAERVAPPNKNLLLGGASEATVKEQQEETSALPIVNPYLPMYEDNPYLNS